MPGSPEFWARTLRERSEHDGVVPVDVEGILKWCPVDFQEVPLEGCLGACVHSGANVGILIKEGLTEERRRFTIAHELGHFAIPSHSTAIHRCLHDVIGVEDGPNTEREADAFAAEMLMPRTSFGADVRQALPSFTLVKAMAAPERYHVSNTACAMRVVDLSPEPCVLLCYEGGKLRWQRRSKTFRYVLPARGSAPPVGSAVADACTKGVVCNDPVSVADVSWLAENWDCEDVLETTLTIPTQDIALSLLTVVRER